MTWHILGTLFTTVVWCHRTFFSPLYCYLYATLWTLAFLGLKNNIKITSTYVCDNSCLYFFIFWLQAQLIAQSIGQAFSVAYQEFLRANGINPEDLSQKEYSDIINTQEMYNDDLIHFSNSENCKEVCFQYMYKCAAHP